MLEKHDNILLCYVFRARINSPICSFCVSALGLVLFQISVFEVEDNLISVFDVEDNLISGFDVEDNLISGFHVPARVVVDKNGWVDEWMDR